MRESMNRRTVNPVRWDNSYARHAQRMLSSLLAVASVIFMFALLLPTPAMAQTGILCSATGNEGGQADDLHYFLGETVQVTGEGFVPMCDLNVRVDRPDGSFDTSTISTDVNGKLAYSYAQTGLLGNYQLNFAGQD